MRNKHYWKHIIEAGGALIWDLRRTDYEKTTLTVSQLKKHILKLDAVIHSRNINDTNLGNKGLYLNSTSTCPLGEKIILHKIFQKKKQPPGSPGIINDKSVETKDLSLSDFTVFTTINNTEDWSKNCNSIDLANIRLKNCISNILWQLSINFLRSK